MKIYQINVSKLKKFIQKISYYSHIIQTDFLQNGKELQS